MIFADELEDTTNHFEVAARIEKALRLIHYHVVEWESTLKDEKMRNSYRCGSTGYPPDYLPLAVSDTRWEATTQAHYDTVRREVLKSFKDVDGKPVFITGDIAGKWTRSLTMAVDLICLYYDEVVTTTSVEALAKMISRRISYTAAVEHVANAQYVGTVIKEYLDGLHGPQTTIDRLKSLNVEIESRGDLHELIQYMGFEALDAQPDRAIVSTP